MSLSPSSCRPSALLAALVALLGSASVCVGGGLVVARDGQPVATIVSGGHTGPAEALADYLRQITGASLPIVPARTDELEDTPLIVLETVEKVPGASDRETARQAYRIVTDGKVLRLSGGSGLAVEYAVWGLLEDHLGCRFYSFQAKGLSYAGRGHEVVPKRPTLALGAIDDLQEPAFQQRGFIFWLPAARGPWVHKNRGGGFPADTVAAGHNFYHLLPPQDVKRRGKVIRKGLFDDHPEWYPMNEAGERKPTWSMGLCGTNPGLARALAEALQEEVEKRIARGKHDPAVPLSAAQGDGFTGCQCEACRRLVREQQSEAAPLILLLNRALDILDDTYPDQQVITFAYFQTLDAPKTLRPHRNLWINVVSSAKSQNMAGDQVGPILGNPANRDYARALAEWPAIAPGRVTTWHWVPYRAEWPSIFYLDDIVRYWHKCGIAGTNPQLCSDVWKWLHAWLYLKLAWNPQADAERLIRQFLKDYYGARAAPHLWKYLKLAQGAYEDSVHCPSAVRWSGWTPTTRLKIFGPALPRMTELMDRALEAARREEEPVTLQHVRQTMGKTIDVVNMDAARSTGYLEPVADPDGAGRWLVPGGHEGLVASLQRAKDGIVASGGGEHGVLRQISWFVARNGGPIVALQGGALAADVCPDLAGQITSLRHLPTEKELLGDAWVDIGYQDQFGRINSPIWLPPEAVQDAYHWQKADRDWARLWSEFHTPRRDRLTTVTILSARRYGFNPRNHLRRTVALDEGAGTLRVERQYTVEKGGEPARPARFDARWLLALPEPRRAKIAVRGAGLDRLLDLKYIEPGGIRGVQAGESLPGLDAMNERFDDVIAVSDAQVVALPIAADAAGELTVLLDRGDGLAVVLRSPSAGWEKIEVQPVVDKNYVRVTLVGAALEIGGLPASVNLPVQTLTTRDVPKAPAPAAPAAEAKERKPAPRLKHLASGRAVNQTDGTELVWVPAGEFLRGSPKGKGGRDERPHKRIHLDGYWIGKTPVTLGQYRKYCEATGTGLKPPWGQAMHAEPKAKDESYPVLVNWYEARDYARWAGAALPTEAQWEKAARGTDGREYPWGDQWDPEKAVGLEMTEYRFSPGMRPVGTQPDGASPYGVLDMAGNCWEWVADWYEHDYYRRAPDRNPTGPKSGTHKVLRGGDSMWDERFSRCAARMVMPPHVRNWVKTTFRLVVPGDAAKPEP